MNSKTTISISQARKKIFAIAEEVQNPSVYYTLTDKGAPKVVLLSAEEFESWMETLEIARDFPDLKKDIKEVRKDLASGAYRKYAGLGEKIEKNDLYAVRRTPQTARRKRARKA